MEEQTRHMEEATRRQWTLWPTRDTTAYERRASGRFLSVSSEAHPSPVVGDCRAKREDHADSKDHCVAL